MWYFFNYNFTSISNFVNLLRSFFKYKYEFKGDLLII